MPLPRLMLTILSLAWFMEALDTTILNTAIPSIAQSFNITPLNLKIALISYLVSLAIFIPLSGWMSDRFGAKRIFISAIAIFTVSSFWCGWSSSLLELVIARAVQGLGGAMMLPVGRVIILYTVSRQNFIRAVNFILIPSLIGPALGPFIGGLIVTHFTWSWIFWLNVPIGLIAILSSWRYLPTLPKQVTPPLDYLGFIWFGISLAGLIFGLGLLSESQISLVKAASLTLSSLIGIIGYLLYARRQANPYIGLALFKRRTFRLGLLGNVLARAGFGSLFFLLPLFLQLPLGYSAQMAGFITGLIAIGGIVVRLFVKYLIKRWGFKHLLIVNTLLLTVVQILFATISSHTSLFLIGVFSFIAGFIIFLQFGVTGPLSYAETTQADNAMAASLISTLQQVGSSLSVALAALLLKGFADSTHHLTLAAFHGTFIVLSVVTLSALFIFYRLKPQDGSNLY